MFDVQTQNYGLDELIDWPETTEAMAEPRPMVQPGYQLPGWIWRAMFACYGIFFGAMFMLSRGSGHAVMMVVISALYALMFFGVASLLAKQPPRDARSPLDEGKPLMTWCGPMDRKAVIGQVLVVPFGIAFFGLAILTIRAIVGG